MIVYWLGSPNIDATVQRTDKTMGMDAIELIMGIEEAFDVQIHDVEVQSIRTVGELYELILNKMGGTEQKKVEPRSSTVCLTAATFYQIRSAIVFVLGLPRNRVRPSTDLHSILPRQGRREVWLRIQENLGLNLPELGRPSWLVAILAVFVVAGAIASALALAPAFGFVVLAISWFIAFWISKPFATIPKREYALIGGLTHIVLAKNFRAIHQEYNGGNPNDVWNTLRVIIVDQLGVEPNEVTPDADLVRDLGCD